MRQPSRFFALALCGALTACAKDQSFAPPAENEYVTVSVKLPRELSVESVKVMYRSAACKDPRYDGNFNKVEVDGHHVIESMLHRKKEHELYEVKLAVNGGGQCKWLLSNVTFGVVHGEPELFGQGTTAGGGGGIIVILDHNNAQHGGPRFLVDGDVSVEENYYPWVQEGFLGGHYKRVVLYAGDFVYLIYKATSARNIYFEPVFHSGLVTYSVGPKVKKKGNNPVFTYPDGSVVADGSSEPDLDILEAIRAKAERH